MTWKVFYQVRVWAKLLWRSIPGTVVASFCKRCGRGVHDFVAPVSVWEKVDHHIRWGHTLCYDCFCDVCGQLGLPTIWHIVDMGVGEE